jgi:hypothetical protein
MHADHTHLAGSSGTGRTGRSSLITPDLRSSASLAWAGDRLGGCGFDLTTVSAAFAICAKFESQTVRVQAAANSTHAADTEPDPCIATISSRLFVVECRMPRTFARFEIIDDARSSPITESSKCPRSCITRNS